MNLAFDTIYRAKQDRFFTPHMGAAKWRGVVGNALDWVTEFQLMDELLWERLEIQFGTTKDDDGSWRGEFWGKVMRGAAFVYAATGNEELYELMESSTRRLLTYQDEWGRICTHSVEGEFTGWDLWSRKYVLLGCFYFYGICKDKDLQEQIVTAMRRHTDYIMERIGDGKRSILETSNFWGGMNSSSILEPVVLLYKLTGDGRYLDFATYIIKMGGSSLENIFKAAYENEKAPYQYGVDKAYEMMSCFEGLLEYYRVTGNEDCKTAVVNFVDAVAKTDITIIGCAGCRHEQFDHSALRQFDPTERGLMQETCVTVTWMKLCWQLLRLTGEARYAEYMERSAFNALLGTMNTERSLRNGGMPFDSYSPLLLQHRGRQIGGLRGLHGHFFYGCCVAIAAAGIGLLGAFPVMASRDGVVVNTFADGTVSVPVGEQTVTVTMETAYPADGTVALHLGLDRPQEFTLRIRIPSFSRNTTLTVNGETVPCVAGEYAEIRRVWDGSETVSLTLDTSPRRITPAEFGGSEEPFVAVECGPLVMARDARFKEDIARPVSLGDALQAEEAAAPFAALKCIRIGDVTMANYSDCGKTWDKRSLLTVWMPTK